MPPEIVSNMSDGIIHIHGAVKLKTRMDCGLVGERRHAVSIPDGNDGHVPMWTFQLPETQTIRINLVLFYDPQPGSTLYWRIGAILGRPLSERTDNADIEDFYERARKIRANGRRVREDDLDWQLQTAVFDAQNGNSVLPHQ